MRLILFIAITVAGFTSVASTTWTDYFGGTPPTSGTVTIAAGNTVVVNDDEMTASAGCTVKVAVGAVLQLDTSTFPTFTIGDCRGTVEKISSADWTPNKSNSNFKGTFIISSGTISCSASSTKSFGSPTALDTGTLCISNGATLAISGTSATLGTIKIRLGGTINIGSSSFTSPLFRFLTLVGDSTIEVASNKATTPKMDAFNDENPAYIDLNGHNLTVSGAGALTLRNGSIKGDGNIAIAAGTSTAQHVLALDNFAIEDGVGNTFTMGDYTTLSTTTDTEMKRTVVPSATSATLSGAGWTTFTGGVSGSDAAVAAFWQNAMAGGRAVFPGAALNLGAEMKSSYSSIDEGTLWVGHAATGALHVAAGCIVSNRLAVGGTSVSRQYQQGNGLVWQTGGEVDIIGDSIGVPDHYSSAIGYSAHGCLMVTGGTTRVLGAMNLGLASPGMIIQTGGTFEQVSHPLAPSSTPHIYASLTANDTDATNIPSVFHVGGGTMRLGQVMATHGKGAKTVISVDGPDALLETPERIYTGFKAGTTLWVGINGGGVLATPYFAFSQNVDSKLYVSFDGGTLKTMPKVAGSSEMSTIFGDPSGSVPAATRVTVGPRGAAIDTNGRAMFVDVPLAAPYGKVVAAIPFSAESGWSVAPYVEIADTEGTGAGATAIADFDPATGTLNGFKVTCGGWGYTAAVARIVVGKTTVREVACTLADADASGSFTKKGEGTLTLSAANTYGGDTVVEGGVLKLAVAGALPSGSRVVLRGGAVNAATGVAFPSSLTVDPAALVPGEAYVLSTSYAGAGVPEIVGAPGWVARVRGGQLVLVEERGMMLIFH